MPAYRRGEKDDAYNYRTLERRKFPIIVKAVGHASDLGRRETNEDETIMKPKFTLDGKHSKLGGALSFFGVFDGHGGRKAAEFARDHVLENLKFSLLQSISVEESFRYAYVRTEYDFFEASPAEETSGTTAVCLLIHNSSREYWIANAGDSRAILCKSGKAVQLTQDHRVTNAAEVARIEKLGGFVRNRRAMGRLECFRTIGDADVDCKVVTAEPEMTSGVLEPEDEFFVLGCDGLYDVLSNDEVCEYVREQIAAGLKANDIAVNLARYAITEKGSKDNVSVVLVVLKQEEIMLMKGDDGEDTKS